MRSFIALAALVPLAIAQTTTSTGIPASATSLPSCALTCTLSTITAGAGGCTSATDLSCICTSSAFQSSVYQCYVNSCTADEITAAVAYGQQICTANGTPLSNTGAVPSGVTTPAASDASSVAESASMSASSGASVASSSISREMSSMSSMASMASASASMPASGAEKIVGGLFAALAAAVAGIAMI